MNILELIWLICSLNRYYRQIMKADCCSLIRKINAINPGYTRTTKRQKIPLDEPTSMLHYLQEKRKILWQQCSVDVCWMRETLVRIKIFFFSFWKTERYQPYLSYIISHICREDLEGIKYKVVSVFFGEMEQELRERKWGLPQILSIKNGTRLTTGRDRADCSYWGDSVCATGSCRLSISV